MGEAKPTNAHTFTVQSQKSGVWHSQVSWRIAVSEYVRAFSLGMKDIEIVRDNDRRKMNPYGSEFQH
jgi:hypothetical protein